MGPARTTGSYRPLRVEGRATDAPPTERGGVQRGHGRNEPAGPTRKQLGPALSDNRPTYGAEGSEWRTPPLWGIGLTQVVNGHQNFLHDGRARSLLEAVLWHGGEAQQSNDAVRAMTTEERAALLAFLNAL